MSQASKQVDWCVRKADEEIEECKRNNERPKHRGLLRIEPDIENEKRNIAKAEHNLKVSQYLIDGGFTDTSLGTIFYSMYQCFLAISLKFGYETRNQTCTISLVEYLIEENKIELNEKFVKYFKYEDNEIKDSIIEMREDYTYGSDIMPDKSKIDFFMRECKELIDITRNIIFK